MLSHFPTTITKKELKMNNKWKDAKGYWTEHEGLRIPELPYFNDSFIESERVEYFIDHVAKRVCTDHQWWVILETNYVNSLDLTQEEYDTISEGQNYLHSGYPSGFELSIENILADDPECKNALHNLKHGSCYTDDWEKIWNKEPGYKIHNQLKKFFKSRLQEENLWGDIINNNEIKTYNEILNELITETEILTAKAICKISPTGETE